MNLRVDPATKRLIAQLQRHGNQDKVPTASEIMREAVRRMHEQDVKANGHRGRGK